MNQMNQGKEPKLDSIYLPDKETMDQQEAHLKSSQTREQNSMRKRSQSYLGVQKPIVDKHTQSVADASISTVHRFLQIHHTDQTPAPEAVRSVTVIEWNEKITSAASYCLPVVTNTDPHSPTRPRTGIPPISFHRMKISHFDAPYWRRVAGRLVLKQKRTMENAATQKAKRDGTHKKKCCRFRSCLRGYFRDYWSGTRKRERRDLER